MNPNYPENYPGYPVLPPPAQPQKKNTGLIIGLAIGGSLLFFVLCCGGGSILLALAGSDDSEPVGHHPAAAASPEDPEESESASTYAEPTKDDFKLAVKTLSTECFGSAGCLLTFRVDIDHRNDKPLDPYKWYDVTYKVTGGDEPLTDTIEVTGDAEEGYFNLLRDTENTIEASANAGLKAVTTSVSLYKSCSSPCASEE
ncbi:MAG TPA: hypothetical protein VF944_05160 [Candidatus Bathyarchaeia archaeon]